MEARRLRRAGRSCCSRRIPGRTNRIRTARTRRRLPYGAEWYGSAADICRVHAALQAAAVGKAAPVKQILSAIPGIDLDQAEVALHRRQGRKPARRPDLQLVRGRPHRPAVGGQLPVELAALPQPDRGGAGCCRSRTERSILVADRPELQAGAQRPGVPAEVHHRAAYRCNVDAPERLRRRIECHQDRGADHRRVRDGDQPGATGGQ